MRTKPSATEPGREAGLFEGFVCDRVPYRLRIAWPDAVQETEDPYSFGSLLGDLDLHLFNEGRHFELAGCLGAQCRKWAAFANILPVDWGQVITGERSQGSRGCAVDQLVPIRNRPRQSEA